MKTLFSSILIFLSLNIFGQTKIFGVIKDEFGYEIPFASVHFADNSFFTNADAEGNYTISCKECTSDTLYFKAIGYKLQKSTYLHNTDQKIDIVLQEDIIQLDEVILESVENPAFPIMREVIKNKDKNDKRSLNAYQYESYTKIELDANNISEDFMQKKLLNKLNTSLEELQKLVDDKGRQFFPVFISETISDYHYKKQPESTKEIVKATRVTGVGVSDGSFTSQLIGASFTNFNLYQNSLSVAGKEIISPIANGWRLYYDYELIDSVFINDRFSYELDIQPKNVNAAAFVGKIWVDKETFGLTKVDIVIPPTANINYIKSIELIREWTKTEAGPFFPRRTDIVIDAENINDKWAGAMIKTTFTTDSLIVNKPLDKEFYKYPIEVNEDAQGFSNEYWESNRHDSLSQHEKDAFALVDTIKNLPVVRSYIDIFNIIVNGYLDVGKVAFGPYISTYARNDIEENRFRLGFKTNTKFSKKMFYKGYLAYGTGDKILKHNLQGTFILSRKPYIEAGLKWRNDLDQLGVNLNNNIFDSFTRWGTLIGPYYHDTKEAYIFKQLNRHFSSKISLRKEKIDPVFSFQYYKDLDNLSQVQSQINTTEIEFETKFSHNEKFLQTDYGRSSLGSKKPEFTLNYTLGLKDILNSDFDYHKLKLSMSTRIKAGILGMTDLRAGIGKTFGALPYPLLNIHLGNQSPIYIYSGYNMMNYFEFVSDQHIELKVVHHFQGILFDRIPLFKKLKWREVVNVSALWGNVSQGNYDIIEPTSRIFGTFENYPYAEIGYGVENIFKILRVELFQRLTYLDRPNVNRFGVKIGFRFTL